MAATATVCKHIQSDNFRGTACRLSGASVGRDCGNPADDAGECIPRLALCYLRGDRESFARLGRVEREAVMAMARTIRERIAAGLIRHDDTKETVMTDDITDLSKLSAEELLGLAARAKAAARERRRADRQVEAARPALEAERDRCMARVAMLDEALAALDRGEPVDLRALGLKLRRGRRQQREGARAAADKPPARGLSPEERYARAVRMLERNAKRYGWSRKKLAEAKAKAREKAGLGT